MTRTTALILVACLCCGTVHADDQPPSDSLCPEGIWAVALSGSTAWIGTKHALLAVDTSDPSALRARVVADLDCGVVDLVAAGSYLFVATARGGLQIFSIEDPLAPEEIGFFDAAGSANGVAVAPPFVFLAAYEGLEVIDVSNPWAPVEVERFETPNVCRGVALDGDLAYVLAGWTPDLALYVIDVSTPWSPQRLGEWDLRQISVLGDASIPGGRLWVSGGFALVADPNRGLLVFDVSEPSCPKFVTRSAFRGVTGVDVAGRYGFVTSFASGLHILDLANACEPREVGRLDMPQLAYEVVIRDDLALVADGIGGLRSVDVSDVTAPSELDAVAVTPRPHVEPGSARPAPLMQRPSSASRSDGGSGD